MKKQKNTSSTRSVISLYKSYCIFFSSSPDTALRGFTYLVIISEKSIGSPNYEYTKRTKNYHTEDIRSFSWNH